MRIGKTLQDGVIPWIPGSKGPGHQSHPEGESSWDLVPWSKRSALPLLGYSSLPAIAPFPCPTKLAASGHRAGGSGSFPSRPRSPQPAESTIADSALQSLLPHPATPICNPNPLSHSWLHQTHQNAGGLPETKTDSIRQKCHGRWQTKLRVSEYPMGPLVEPAGPHPAGTNLNDFCLFFGWGLWFQFF